MATNGTYDLVVLGTGPGGYETAIRASQLGMKTAVIEKNKLGGVCLNIGCIPTKALLSSAEMMYEARNLSNYGLKLDGEVSPDFPAVIDRSREAAAKMNKGVQYLMNKNDIDVIFGYGQLTANDTVEVTPSENMDGETVGEERTVKAKHIIIATGARAREIPPLPVDDEHVIDYWQAMLQKERPDRLVVVGAGAIGVEFAYFYQNMGTEVTIVELEDRLVPVEDKDVSRELARSFKKLGIKIMTGAETKGYEKRDGELTVQVDTGDGVEDVMCDQILSAVGVVGNIEDIGLEDLGIETDSGSITVDEFYRTNVEGVYAIGDVAGGPWLAHKASHEGILCAEKIAGHDVRPMDYGNIPGCTYCQPQIASVGLTEEQAKEEGYEIEVGKFPFTANGKATAAGHTEGFVKVIFDKKYGEWLGCHMIGHGVTELIAEAVTARTLETTHHEIIESVHPHPTMSETVMEAARAAIGEPINI